VTPVYALENVDLGGGAGSGEHIQNSRLIVQNRTSTTEYLN